MKQVILRNGQAVIEDVPPPVCDPREALVQNSYSVISSGTEMSSLSFSGEPIWKKVLNHPEKAAKGIKMLKEKGLLHTYNVVKGMFDFGEPAGYSSSGRVLKVGEEVREIKEGDFVACAGAGWANHAEIAAVPVNLVARVPEGVSLMEAASTTIGAIALQGVRQADLRVGESAVVIGLGLLGQLTVQILRASGVKVFGVEPDHAKVTFAKKFGMEWGGAPGGGTLNEIMIRTAGHGADATIICASTQSSDPVNEAMEYTRKRGKVVVVGAVGLELKRSHWYEKEIDVRISTSYGPGRYDPLYEEQGVDYPYPYVRWTESRNMEAYLQLLKEKKVDFGALLEFSAAASPNHAEHSAEPRRTFVFPLERARDAYAVLQSEQKPMAVVLEYKRLDALSSNERDKDKKIFSVVQRKVQRSSAVSVALIGTGQFAQGTHLPNIAKLRDRVHLRAVVNKDGAKAVQYAKQYKADYAAGDYEEVLNDGKVDAVIITTRHNTHAKMVLEALRAGKHVFVEKPLCLNQQELDEIKNFFEGAKEKSEIKNLKSEIPLLMVGFNRRFSPYAKKIKEEIKDRKNPLILHYRVNAGFIPKEHWVHGAEGGGRIIGEGCHFLDFFNFLIGSSQNYAEQGNNRRTTPNTTRIEAFSITPKGAYYYPNDIFVATLTYEDGSVANLLYTAMGGKNQPKEYVEVYSDGKTFVIDDYKELKVFGAGGGFKSMRQDKGHFEELKQFAKAIKEGGDWPISLEEVARATEQSFEINNLIKR